MGVKGVSSSVEELHRARIPTYAFPESAVAALAAIDHYARWRLKTPGAPVNFEVNREAAREIINKAKLERREQLTDAEAFGILQAYGVPVAAYALGNDWKAVRDAAHQIGFPVALKISAAGLSHKTEIGGVRLDLRDDMELRRSFDELREAAIHKLDPRQIRFLVQHMVEGGREVLIGLHAMPNFGTLIAFGLGGIYVEAVKDVVLRIAPLTQTDASEMVQSVRGVNILRGVRGAPPVDFHKLSTILLRISQLSQDFSEIVEMDINPLMAFDKPEKCVAADARMRISPD
jgi:acetyltransferase